METRANYVLIGAVTLLGILGAFGFFLWYAQIALDRQYDTYDIRFDQVSGLSGAAEVRFNGILVGSVLSIDLSRSGSAVRVSVQVDAGTPINSGTVATLGTQGVTGVSYVSLASGSPDAPRLEPDPATGTLVIPSRPSPLENLLETAPELLTEARDLLQNLGALAGPDNQTRVAQILANVETASRGLEQALTDFSSISGTVRTGVEQITAFTGRLEAIASEAEITLRTADASLASAAAAFDQARTTLGAATGALDAARTTFDSAQTLIEGRAPGLLDRYEGVAEALSTNVDALGIRSAALIGRLDSVADLGAARLREAEATIAAAAPALTAVEGAAGSLESLLSGDGAAVAAEARSALVALNRVLEADAPRILADVRTAAATVNRVVTEVGGDVRDFSGRLDGLSAEATTALVEAGETFRTATATLQRLGPAIGSAERALVSADSAFASADRVMNTDIEPIVADVRAAVARFDEAITQVTDDLPAITGAARGAVEAATRAAQRLEAMVDRSAPPIENFAEAGLPQFVRLAAEARGLVTTLEQLTRRIEQDPARFLLGGRTPEYRQ